MSGAESLRSSRKQKVRDILFLHIQTSNFKAYKCFAHSNVSRRDSVSEGG